MLRKREAINLQLNQILDGLLLALALWGCHAFRFWGTIFLDFPTRIPPFSEFIWLVVLVVPFGPLLLELQGFYNYSLRKTLSNSLSQILRAGLWLFVLIGACVIFLRLEVHSRAVLLCFSILAPALLLLRERIFFAWLRRRAKHGVTLERTLLVGPENQVREIEQSLTPEQKAEMEVVGRLDLQSTPEEELLELLHKESVSLVIFTGGHSMFDRLQNAIAACEVEGVEVWLMADFIRTRVARPDFDRLGDRLMLVFRSTPEISWELIIKNIMDRVGAAILLVILSPLLLLTAAAIKLTSPGPSIFSQQRGGRHGKPFIMYKFRTMESNAEQRHAEMQAMNQMSGPVFKIADDPRVTPLGKILRRTSIDELPQLWNVLLGDMSLVGPRPLPLYEVEQIQRGEHRRRLSVKPGLTCLWQISGRNQVHDFHRWVQLDLTYIDSWSLWLDLKILLKTIPVVLAGYGAR